MFVQFTTSGQFTYHSTGDYSLADVEYSVPSPAGGPVSIISMVWYTDLAHDDPPAKLLSFTGLGTPNVALRVAVDGDYSDHYATVDMIVVVTNSVATALSN